jgi:hypothetical protein
MRDCMGTVVAQTISDTIVITDDHKNHPAAAAPPAMSPARIETAVVEKPPAHSLSPVSMHSPVTTTASQMQSFIQAPAYSHHYPGHMPARSIGDHSIPSTPSRQSPAPQSAPQTKRRKSSKVPAGLTMTPSEPSSQFSTPQYGNPFATRQSSQDVNQNQWVTTPTTPISQPPPFGADNAYFNNMAWSPGIEDTNFGRMKSPPSSHVRMLCCVVYTV